MDEATRVVGLYAPDGTQAGFARVVSDGAVFVISRRRLRLGGPPGAGDWAWSWSARPWTAAPQANLRWLLGTEDAQGFYSKLGFGKPAEIMLERGPDGRIVSAAAIDERKRVEFVIGGILYFVLLVTLGIITIRKGHWVMFILGIFLPLFWIIGALMPARQPT